MKHLCWVALIALPLAAMEPEPEKFERSAGRATANVAEPYHAMARHKLSIQENVVRFISDDNVVTVPYKIVPKMLAQRAMPGAVIPTNYSSAVVNFIAQLWNLDFLRQSRSINPKGLQAQVTKLYDEFLVGPDMPIASTLQEAVNVWRALNEWGISPTIAKAIKQRVHHLGKDFFATSIITEGMQGFSLTDFLEHEWLPDIIGRSGNALTINLTSLGLSDLNGWSALIKQYAINPKHVYRILLSSNSLQSLSAEFIEFLNLCTSLQELSLARNQLTELPSSFLTNAPAGFQVGQLTINQMTSHPALPLQNLDLSFNKLSSVPSGFIRYYTALRIINMEYNQLVSLPEGFAFIMPMLERLELSSNQLADLPSTMLLTCPKLVFLNLANNQLTYARIAGLSRSSLKRAFIYDNQLSFLGMLEFLLSMPNTIEILAVTEDMDRIRSLIERIPIDDPVRRKRLINALISGTSFVRQEKKTSQ